MPKKTAYSQGLLLPGASFGGAEECLVIRHAAAIPCQSFPARHRNAVRQCFHASCRTLLYLVAK